ncbi:MAG: double zinc ribbon domain-containing protein [Actinomycetota bacterium]
MARGLLDVVFPMRCAGCGEGPWPFCAACRDEIVPLLEPACTRCGVPAEETLRSCRHCPPPELRSARAPFLYGGAVRRALLRLKFNGWRAVSASLGRAMAAVNAFEADAVTWVPLSPARRADRGYDQAGALAAVAARALGIRAAAMLIRTVDTPPQTGRSGVERRRAMRGAFHATGRDPPAQVLLVDDVLTTGATAAECARVLLSAGARQVGVLTAARAVAGPLPARCYHRPGSRLSLWLPGTRSR